MGEIIRAQLRQARKTGMLYLVFFLFAFVSCIALLNESSGWGEHPETASDFVCGNMSAKLCSFAIFFLMVAIGWICGADFEDKTINYELSAGRLRREVYLGRVIPGILVGITGTVILSAAPILLIAAFYGWGNSLPLSNALLRLLLTMLPLLRMGAFAAAMTFILKHQLPSVMLAFCTCSLTVMPLETFNMPVIRDLIKNPFVLSAVNYSNLMTVDSWYVYGCFDFKMHYIYYPELSGSMIAGTVIVSLVMTAVYLLIGYHFFHVDDMN